MHLQPLGHLSAKRVQALGVSARVRSLANVSIGADAAVLARRFSNLPQGFSTGKEPILFWSNKIGSRAVAGETGMAAIQRDCVEVLRKHRPDTSLPAFDRRLKNYGGGVIAARVCFECRSASKA